MSKQSLGYNSPTNITPAISSTTKKGIVFVLVLILYIVVGYFVGKKFGIIYGILSALVLIIATAIYGANKSLSITGA